MSGMRAVSVGIVLLAGMAQSAGQSLSTIEDARAAFGCKTHMTYSAPGPKGHGTQIEYLDPDGTAHLWYPGNRVILPGQWRVAMSKDRQTIGICFRYPTPSYNPVTGESGGQWSCSPAERYAKGLVEIAAGDVLQLKGRTTIPFILSPDKTTISTLAAQMKIKLTPLSSGCSALSS